VLPILFIAETESLERLLRRRPRLEEFCCKRLASRCALGKKSALLLIREGIVLEMSLLWVSSKSRNTKFKNVTKENRHEIRQSL
jgi:hypothetical protein